MNVQKMPMMQKHLLGAMFGKIKKGGLCVQYWDGEEAVYGDTKPAVKIIFHKPPAALFQTEDPLLALGEAYMDRYIDYEGNLEDILLLFENNREFTVPATVVAKVLQLTGRFSDRTQAKENIRRHYDLGNDFFSLWLDDTLSYSCAYFRQPDDSLRQAQVQKIDHVLKKLNLKAGETLLDIGSGWGWLIIKAAQDYGVKAMGITLSEEQHRKTEDRIASLGLSGQVRVALLNYLDLDAKQYQFDKIASVGMFEHVGKANIPAYLAKTSSLLKTGGLMLLHSIIGYREDQPDNSWMKTYIFPGGYIPTLREIIGYLPENDFHLLQAESLRLHYAMTLDQWYLNFAKHLDQVRDKFGDRFCRMWELYLKGCAASFRSTGLDVYQLLLSKDLNNHLPLTFEAIYR